MAGKFVDEGETHALQILLNGTAGWGTLYLGLYENTTEPAETAVMDGGITEETIGSNGYARIAITTSNWTVSGDTSTAAEKTFTAATATWGNQYGYFLTTTATGTSGKLLWVEHFSNGPYDVTVGSTVAITAKITAS